MPKAHTVVLQLQWYGKGKGKHGFI